MSCHREQTGTPALAAAGMVSGKPQRPSCRAAWMAASLGLVLLAGCANYQVGNDLLYPSTIRTVHVPVFESTSFRRNLGERLTEAVVKEIEYRTPYKVVGDSRGADSILSGKIVGDRKGVLVVDPNGQPRDVEINLKVQVRWIDRQSNLIREGAPIPLPSQLAEVTDATDLVPEVGQSVATAQQKVIQRLAQQIVGMMEVPW